MDANRHAIPDSPAPPAPAAGRAGPAGAFVGRERELQELMDGLASARSGRGRLFLIGGEAGIGKSRLADELAHRARRMGFRTLWGRCWEAGGAPAYWPWVQSIRFYLRDQEPQSLRSRMGGGVSYLAQLLSEVGALFPDVAPPPSLDPEAARFRLFDAVTTFLRNAAEDEPLLLVLDDLHAADIPSLLLLRFLAGELTGSSLVVVGLYRHDEIGPDHPASAILAELGREQPTQSLLLDGLGETEIALFVEITTGTKPHHDLISAIHRGTEGNALFVGEVVRLLAHERRLECAAEDGSLRLGLPPGVRQVIGRRLRHLSAECRRILDLASVLGREFDLDVLERLSGTARDDLLRALAEAESARVVAEVPGALGRMRFAHALIRDVFYEDLTTAARVRLHLGAGEAMETLRADDLDPHLAELAHHFVEAAPGGAVDRAITYARTAGDRATRLLAFEEAGRLYRMALRALELSKGTDPETRCELLVRLGDVQMRANDVAPGCATFLEAARVARDARSEIHFARAALGYGGRFVWGRASSNPKMIPLLREALAGLGQEDSVLRAQLLARLAGALRDAPTGEERDALSREALAIARRIGDPATLGYALDGRYAAIWEPGNARERLATAEELIRVAEQAGDPERTVQGHHYRLIALLELGEIPEAHAALEIKARVAGELRQPSQLWYVAVMRACMALFEGRIDEAEELIDRAHDLCGRGWVSGGSYRVQMFVLRREQGRLAELEPLIRRSVGEYPVFPMFRSMLALLHTETGREEEARREFEAIAARGFADLPWDCEWLYHTTLLAELACSLGDLPRAATLYGLLEPYASFNVVAPAEVSVGSASRWLGLLAMTLSRWETAERHFRDALAHNTRMGARSWAARAGLDYARMLLARGRAGGREDARDLLRHALRTGEEMRMPALSRAASALLEQPQGAVSAQRLRADGGEAMPQLHALRREGEYWSIRYQGETFRLKDCKGLRHLARLLGEPAREIHVLELVAEPPPGELAATGGVPGRHGLGDAGEVLDSRSKAEYRQRLRELEEEIEEATSWGDSARAERAEEERVFLVRELSRAVGLGGRDRRAVSAAERARVNVTRAIKPTLKKIQEHHPELGQHLASTVRTGTFCSYTPDPRVPIRWEV